LYRYCGWILLQLFVAHASFQETFVLGRRLRPLVEWGRLIGVGDPRPATQAEMVIDVEVELQSGDLAGGSQLIFPASGVLYQVVSAVPLNAATVQATIRDRKSTRLNSSHVKISYAVFCLKKKILIS